jgi:multimeric flavodoxin WrbA
MNRSPVVIGVLGSPRRHGNTEKLLDAFLKGATEAGGTAEKIVLTKLSFTPCKGCNACHKQGDCILHDDIPDLFSKLLAADCIALSSPVYSMGITAELKAFIDRAHYLWVRHMKLKTDPLPPDKKESHPGFFLSTAGMNRDDVFSTAFPMMQAFFNIFGFAYRANILAKDMDGYGGIENNHEIMRIAYQHGYDAVTSILDRKKQG